MMKKGASKRRRSRKRFANIPPLPAGLAIRESEDNGNDPSASSAQETHTQTTIPDRSSYLRAERSAHTAGSFTSPVDACNDENELGRDLCRDFEVEGNNHEYRAAQEALNDAVVDWTTYRRQGIPTGEALQEGMNVLASQGDVEAEKEDSRTYEILEAEWNDLATHDVQEAERDGQAFYEFLGSGRNDPLTHQGVECRGNDFATAESMEGERNESSSQDVLESGWNDLVFSQPTTGDVSQCDSAAANCLSDWRVLWAAVMTNGPRKLTKEQYLSIRIVLEANAKLELPSPGSVGPNALRLTSHLPHYATLQKRVKPIIFRVLAPRYEDYFVNVDTTKAGARPRRKTLTGVLQDTLRIVLPSEYARADVSTPEVFAAMCETSLSGANSKGENHIVPAISASDCIDIVPLIAARDWVYGLPQSVSVDNADCNCLYSDMAEAGDVISVSALTSEPLAECIQRCFGGVSSNPNSSVIEGKIEHLWAVHHLSRKHCSEFYFEAPPQLSQRDKRITEILSFLTYSSPADSVSVDIPDVFVETESPEVSPIEPGNGRKKPRLSPAETQAVRRRKEALKAKKRALDAAWRNWEKPLVKPGDVVALISPVVKEPSSSRTLLTSADKESRICVVFRFWAERDERSRHFIWIPGGAELPESNEHVSEESSFQFLNTSGIFRGITTDRKFHIDILSISLKSVHGGKRGPHRYTPTSSLGKLSTGEPYCVYRFVLYWDGFEMQTGKSATGEGIYLICMNLPVEARSTPSAVRILSLTPPGVKSAAVLDRIIDDIVEGMTIGYVDYDAFGTRRRIFLDLVGVLGDTPALNAALDVLGHTSAACCHLCRIVRRSKTQVGSKFTAKSFNGSATAFRRSFFQHTAVRDCAAQEETCRSLGLKADPSEEKLVLHRMRSRIVGTRGKIPKTSYGNPVVPCTLDPYRACLVAPDHLLTGHFRDCVNLAFKLLPSAEWRASCEFFMLSMLESCQLPKQNRLLDHDKKILYAMSMSELYALSLIAELAFIKGCAHQKALQAERPPLSEISSRAIELVGSASNLISEIWYRPQLERDGSLELQNFNQKYGTEYVSRIQKRTSAHLALLEKICLFSDSDFNALENPETPSTMRNELERVRKASALAIRTVDKPNVHRLLELSFAVLPVLGHASFFGELVFEKAHQILKRAIKKSNNKNVQLQAMESAVFNDWQGRISLCARLVPEGNTEALRSFFRLMRGRIALAVLQGELKDHHEKQMLRALGPQQCILKELQSQSASVMSRRYLSKRVEHWKLRGSFEVLTPNAKLSSAHREETIAFFKHAHPLTWEKHAMLISDAIYSSLEGGIPGRVLRRGDIVQIMVRYPENPDCNFPFIAHANHPTTEKETVQDIGPSLWCLFSVLSIRRAESMESFTLALLPCVRNTARYFGRETFSVLQNAPVSFSQLGPSLQFVPVINACTNLCSRELPFDPFNCTPFIPITRKMGYPPRMG